MKMYPSLIFGSSLVMASVVAAQTNTLFDINDVVLDGGTGANTFAINTAQARSASPADGRILSYSAGHLNLYNATETNPSAFFVNFDGISLTNIGDSISLQYAYSQPNGAALAYSTVGGFRVGFFDSNGSTISHDVGGNADGNWTGNEGYAAFYSDVGTNADNSIRARSSSSGYVLWSSSDLVTISGSPTMDNMGNGDVTGSFTITLTAGGLEVSSVVNGGGEQSVLVPSGYATTFDYFSIDVLGRGATANVRYLDFNELTVTTNVPEPSSSWFCLLGLVMLGGVRRLLGRKNAA